MEMSIKDNGLMIKQKERENMNVKMYHNMTVIGNKISNMVMAFKNGTMGVNIKDSIIKEKNKVKVHIIGQMVVFTKEVG